MASYTSIASLNLRIISEEGYYFQTTKLKVNGKSQTINAILVTELGRLPQLANTITWQRAIVTELPASWSTTSTKQR